MKSTAIALLVVLVALGTAPAALAQGCALCKTAAAATEEPGAKALNRAILVLLIPAILIFLGIFFWAFRYRNRTWQDVQDEEEPVPLPDYRAWGSSSH